MSHKLQGLNQNEGLALFLFQRSFGNDEYGYQGIGLADYPVHDVSDRNLQGLITHLRWFQYRALLRFVRLDQYRADQNQYERYKYQNRDCD